MIDPNTGGVLDGDAVIVNDTSKVEVLNDDIGGIGNGNALVSNMSTRLVTSKSLV